jgi:uncharacterized protein (TIGR03435 family)
MVRPAMLLKLFLLVLLSHPGLAQSPAAPSLTFDAVSIKPNKSGSGRTSVHTSNDRFQATNISLKELIRDAYDVQTLDQVIGLPSSINSVNFDIEAKVDAETLAILKAASREESGRLRDGMMKSVLAERFHLKVHPETRELPIFELTLAKGGSKLQNADPADPKGDNMHSDNQKLTATGIPISNLCNFLSRRLHRQVLDKTGLTGKYDFVLQWSPDEASGESPDASGANQAPSLFTALQEQLGLKLESTKVPVDTIVIDHVEMPSEN